MELDKREWPPAATSLSRAAGDKRTSHSRKPAADETSIPLTNLAIMRDDYLSNEARRKMERGLANQIIDAGYRAIAASLHPDRGGDAIRFGVLSDVRKRLKHLSW
jgi:hypothetical protein